MKGDLLTMGAGPVAPQAQARHVARSALDSIGVTATELFSYVVTFPGGSKIEFVRRGRVHKGELRHGMLYWDDGDVWQKEVQAATKQLYQTEQVKQHMAAVEAEERRHQEELLRLEAEAARQAEEKTLLAAARWHAEEEENAARFVAEQTTAAEEAADWAETEEARKAEELRLAMEWKQAHEHEEAFRKAEEERLTAAWRQAKEDQAARKAREDAWEEAAAREAEEEAFGEASKKTVEYFLRTRGFKDLWSPRKASFFRCCRAPVYPLHLAVEEGSPEMVRALLHCNANPEQTSSRQPSPLQVAERCNRNGSHDAIVRMLRPAP